MSSKSEYYIRGYQMGYEDAMNGADFPIEYDDVKDLPIGIGYRDGFKDGSPSSQEACS